MNTKNTKSAVIILLMMANIFFIYNIIMLDVSTRNIPAAMIENAVNVLASNGFTVDKSVIPAKKPTSYIYEGVYSGDFKEIVTGFSGVSAEEIQDLPPLPDEKTKYNEGGYIFIFDKSDYHKISIMTEAHIKAKDDYRELEIETAAEMTVLMETEKENTVSVQKSDTKKTEKIISDFLKTHHNYQKTQKTQKIQKTQKTQKPQNQEINPDFDFDIIVLEKRTGSEPEKVIINQKIDGLPINSHIVYVEIKNGEVQYFYGRWYFGTIVAGYKRPLLDSVNILFKYSGDLPDSVKLEKMDLEYNIRLLSNDEFYLMPSWVLLFGDGEKLSYDMIIGKKN